MPYSAVENRSLQLNPNNWRYWRSRGYDEIPGSTGCMDNSYVRIITFPFKVITCILLEIFSLILKLLLLLVTSYTGWVLIISAVLVIVVCYLYYYFFHCHGQIYRFEFNNCTTPTINLPVNITKPTLPTVEDFPFMEKILSATQNI